MAKLIPTRASCLPRMTPGERRLSERLEGKLEDDYLLWYDVALGPRQLRPDFVILHPRRGLLVLEVKDWKEDTIREADRIQFALSTARGLVREPNPLAKARLYAEQVKSLLECDPALRHGAGSPHAGKLVMPWAHGVVFANIPRRPAPALKAPAGGRVLTHFQHRFGHAVHPVAAARGPAVKRAGDAAPSRTILRMQWAYGSTRSSASC